jgi:hypothetical protein
MSIQFDNTAAGVVTLKPGASGSYSMTLPTSNAAGGLVNDGSGNLSFGTVPNATTAVVAGTVTTAAQGNITSVGTLSSLSVTGNIISSGNVGIGTSSPTGKLDISATTDSQVMAQVRNLSNGTSAYSAFFLGNDTNATAAYVGLNSSTNTARGGGTNSFNIITGLNGPITFGVSGTEYMRIVSGGNVGIGTSSPGAKLQVNGSVAFASGQFTSDTNGSLFTQGNTLSTSVPNGAVGINTGPAGGTGLTLTNKAGNAVWETLAITGIASQTSIVYVADSSGNALLRVLGSGNVGIGTGSPAARLDVTGGNIKLSDANAVIWGLNASLNFIKLFNSSSNGVDISSSGNMTLSTVAASTSMIFNTVATERMRLDANGNLGIGITPSAWVSGRTAIELNGSTQPAFAFNSTSSPNNGGVIVANAYYASGTAWTYKSTGYATQYLQGSGTHVWYNAPSGTAGTAITFTERMRLDTNGDVILGYNQATVSQVVKSFATAHSAANRGGEVRFGINDGSFGGIIIPDVASSNPAYNAQYIRFETHQGGVSAGERMRITADGYVGIATTTPAALLQVGPTSSGAINGYTKFIVDSTDYAVATLKSPAANFSQIIFTDPTSTLLGGIYYFNSSYATPNAMAFYTGASERVRIDASGYVGIGTSTPSQQLTLASGYVQTGNGIGGAGGVLFPYGGDAGTRTWRVRTDHTAYGDWGVEQSTTRTGTTFETKLLIDPSGNFLVGTTSQIKSSKQSVYSGATNATTYNTASFQGGSVLTIQNQQTTSVSTAATVIATTGIYATLALVYGSDGTNRFQDLVMFGLGTGTVNVISSLAVAGTPSSRTYSQSSSTYRLAMGSGTYTVQFSGLTQGD